MPTLSRTLAAALVFSLFGNLSGVSAQDDVDVEGQPLAANVLRVIDALDYLGRAFDSETERALRDAAKQRDATALQKLLDPLALLIVEINPELRVKVARGPSDAVLQQGGFTPVLVKVLNAGTTTRQLEIVSPQAGTAYAGESEFSLERQEQTELKSGRGERDDNQFLKVEMFRSPPMTPALSGLQVEYVIALIHSDEAGRREATIGFDLGGGNQDLGFRGEVPVLFDVQPAIPVTFSIRDFEGSPTTARLTIRDQAGHVFPPQARRVAPDFFFQPQVYRHDGETVLLPPGKYTLRSSRGPEYRIQDMDITIGDSTTVSVQLERWINPMDYGFYCGDHHIHGAGCAHYNSPTLGVTPEDMYRQVKGEGLNVGCVLTWGPCFEFQRQYFSPQAKTISEPLTLLKYDLEISGFGSAALGHVCLLNLKDQTYPESDGTKSKGWPTWTVPVMRWTKAQGGVTGYPHSAIYVVPEQAAEWLIASHDGDKDQRLSAGEAIAAVLPAKFDAIDRDGNGLLDRAELSAATDAAADQLPNLALPGMTGSGAMEIFVSGPEGVCDFISAMDTARIPEWNTWYHLMNTGLPIRLSGETDFPCMSSRSVGRGRVYVQLGDVDQLDFTDWCNGIASGRSYVSDGYAHAVEFTVDDVAPGTEPVMLDQPSSVTVRAKVAFAEEVPEAVAYGTQSPPSGRRRIGDTINLHNPRTEAMVKGGMRSVELVMNGNVVGKQEVPADGGIHEITFQVPVTQSSWIAVRQFPQLHTNPVEVLVDGLPIRASRGSARWCAEAVSVLWKNRSRFISEAERPDARNAYDRAIAYYRMVAEESSDD